MDLKRRLKRGEIEIVWANGSMETIQTDGMTYNAGTIVLSVGVHQVIVPMSAVRRFRVLGVQAVTEELEAEKRKNQTLAVSRLKPRPAKRNGRSVPAV